MNQEKIRNYLNERYKGDDILTNENFDKILFTAYTFIKVYFPIESLDEDTLSPIVAEEALFISKYDIDFNAYYEYNGLSTFDIAGVVKGTMGDVRGELFPPIVKGMLEKAGIVIQLNIGRVKNQYTYL